MELIEFVKLIQPAQKLEPYQERVISALSRGQLKVRVFRSVRLSGKAHMNRLMLETKAKAKELGLWQEA